MTACRLATIIRYIIDASVRRVIAAWATAEGDEAALAAVARPEAVQALLHPTRAAGKRTRLAARGLRITYIMVDRLRADAEPPLLGISFSCAGLRYIEDLDTGSVLSATATPRHLSRSFST